jgi:hypothetical protein
MEKFSPARKILHLFEFIWIQDILKLSIEDIAKNLALIISSFISLTARSKPTKTALATIENPIESSSM